MNLMFRSQHRQIFHMAEETDYHQVNTYLSLSESIIKYHNASHDLLIISWYST